MLRDWVNWCWLSGDHIVEQHVHNLDVITWFMGRYPVKAMGMGGRMRRPTGDQYDFFAVDYTMDNGIHVQSTCRQIDSCANTFRSSYSEPRALPTAATAFSIGLENLSGSTKSQERPQAKKPNPKAPSQPIRRSQIQDVGVRSGAH